MRTMGVDLASQDRYTALCVVDWEGRGVQEVRLGVGDDAIVEAARTVERTGIDAPFGWPEAFVDAVTGWHDGVPWPAARGHSDSLQALRYRVTDHATRAVTGIVPLSVSTDLISVVAIRCARLLTALAGIGPLDRSGCTGVACEAYPAAALKRWALPHRGYKKRDAVESRNAILAALLGALDPFHVPKHDRAVLVDSDHALDAFVAALIARAVLLGATTTPSPGELAAARVEGWIHVPDPGSLATLA